MKSRTSLQNPLSQNQSAFYGKIKCVKKKHPIQLAELKPLENKAEGIGFLQKSTPEVRILFLLGEAWVLLGQFFS